MFARLCGNHGHNGDSVIFVWTKYDGIYKQHRRLQINIMSVQTGATNNRPITSI